MKLDYYCYTSPGGRSPNEDAVGARVDADGALFVIADGLGGHKDGSLASKCVVDTLLATPLPLFADEGEEWFQKAFEAANDAVLSQQEKNRCRMKTTVAALLVQDSECCWSHVGDSRVYQLHQGNLTCTADHSVAYKKYLAGEISRWQIGQDEDQSSLLRALGNKGRHHGDFAASGVCSGDAFLLCTDGVWTHLQEEEIVIDRHKSESAKEWAEALLLRVLNRCDGNHDNLSLIAILCTDES